MNKLIILSLFLALIFTANSHQIFGENEEFKHECIHDKIASEFEPLPNMTPEEIEAYEKSGRKLGGLNKETAQPFRLHFDYSTLLQQNGTQAQKDWIKNKLMPVGAEYLAKRLKVQRVEGKLKFPSHISSCYKAKPSDSMRSVGVDADMVIFVSGAHEASQRFAAWAIACVTDYQTGRPIFGQVNFNMAYLKVSESGLSYKVATTLHEIVHVLGFSRSRYSQFRDENGNKRQVVMKTDVFRGVENTKIVTPKVVATAKKYYNCPTVDGMELENEGGSGSRGSHWEKSILMNEFMTAQETADSSFSEFTMAILEDSGWYAPVYEMASPMYFGKDEGCEFLKKGCNGQYDEYCYQQGARLCDFNMNKRGECRGNTFMSVDKCYYVSGYSNGDCRQGTSSSSYYGTQNGPDSKCVMSSVKQGSSPGQLQALCYKYECTGGKVIFKVGSSATATCSQKGEKAQVSGSGYTGQFDCPDPAHYCREYYPNCPNYCSGNGFCHNGVCECQIGFTGADCSKTGVEKSCPNNCSGKGTCHTSTGTCECSTNYSGDDCSKYTPQTKQCPQNCSNQGNCDTSSGKCTCYTDYFGDDCSQKRTQPKQCPQNCSNQGKCDTTSGKCTCYTDYFGDDCSQKRIQPKQCPNNCSNKGYCNTVTGVCTCSNGYTGSDCSVAPTSSTGCKNNCGGWKGTCDKTLNKCVCKYRYGGDDCSKYSCGTGDKANCSGGQGTCRNLGSRGSYCVCKSGISGYFCDQKAKECPNNCSNVQGKKSQGYCYKTTGKCYCYRDWKGDDCSQSKNPTKTCPNNCSQNGSCNTTTGQCSCKQGYSGNDCGTRDPIKCPNNCSDRGSCDTTTGKCSCKEGFSGNDCGTRDPIQCPNNCNQNGSCDTTTGKCSCKDGFSGNDCGTRDPIKCPNNCSDRGTCDVTTGKCSCKDGFSGNDCGTQDPIDCPNDCSENGACDSTTGKCSCNKGFSGEDCSQEEKDFCETDSDCNNQGECVFSQRCMCYSGAEGERCQTRTDKCNCSANQTAKWIISDRFRMVWCECDD